MEPASNFSFRYTVGADQIMDFARGLLHSNQFVVYEYIHRRTIKFHKLTERITLEQFVTGKSWDGDYKDFGVNLSAATVRRILPVLVRYGLISREDAPGEASLFTFTVDFDAVDWPAIESAFNEQSARQKDRTWAARHASLEHRREDREAIRAHAEDARVLPQDPPFHSDSTPPQRQKDSGSVEQKGSVNDTPPQPQNDSPVVEQKDSGVVGQHPKKLVEISKNLESPHARVLQESERARPHPPAPMPESPPIRGGGAANEQTKQPPTPTPPAGTGPDRTSLPLPPPSVRPLLTALLAAMEVESLEAVAPGLRARIVSTAEAHHRAGTDPSLFELWDDWWIPVRWEGDGRITAAKPAQLHPTHPDFQAFAAWRTTHLTLPEKLAARDRRMAESWEEDMRRGQESLDMLAADTAARAARAAKAREEEAAALRKKGEEQAASLAKFGMSPEAIAGLDLPLASEEFVAIYMPLVRAYAAPIIAAEEAAKGRPS